MQIGGAGGGGGGGDGCFSENFEYVLNEWFLTSKTGKYAKCTDKNAKSN